MYPQQPNAQAGGGPGGYPSPPPSSGQAGQAAPYPPQPQQLQQSPSAPPLQQHQPFQQQPLAGPGPSPGPSAAAQSAPSQPQAGPEGSAPPEQPLQPSTSTGGASPPKSGGFMRFFGGRKQQAADASGSSPGQATSPPGASGGGQGSTSPERRRMLGIFRRSNAMNEQQQQHPEQQQPPQDPQQLLQAGQTGSAPPSGLYPPLPDGQAPTSPGGSAAQLQSGVPVVPPATGMCSRAPPAPEEVARLQSSPLAPSKFASLNQAPVPSTRRSVSNPNAPAVDPQFSGPAPLEEKYGPYLRYGGYDPVTRIYSASVMMVIHQSRSRYPPTLKYRDTHRHGPGSAEELRSPVRLWSWAGYNFWRWDMSFQLGGSPAVVEYWVVCSEDHLFTTHIRHHFHLPTAGQKWHWGFYSCNGFHDHNDEVANGGIQPLWRDVMHLHARDPLHVMFGGGDQLYCDDVWKLNSLLQWTLIQDKPSRNAHPFSQDMVNEVFDFYFRNYTTHFGKEVFRDALASIPQVMVWDDHDIFDGWGSYPPDLQTCPVFSGVYFVARKFYLLFQCHAAEDNYRELNKGWGLTGLSWTVMLGNTTAVVGLDSRGERTRRQIIRPASWAAFSDQVAKLPAGVRHVVVVASVPLVYPTVPGIEEAMMALAGTGLMVSALTAFLQKTGLSTQIYSQFGEPELLDDLLDHWSARSHEVEKYCFVRMMQDLAKARGIRFSILAGDVHCAGVAAFQTMPKVNLRTDHRYMVQVISSAIGNVPPPDAVIKALSASNKPKMLDPVTREKMRPIFENNTLLKASRNWCDIHERPLLPGAAATSAMHAGGVSGGPADGSLVFQLRVEHPIYKEVRPYTYDIEVPVLELPAGSFSPLPLPVAPPLPQPLMLKFQEELVAAGVGLEAAMPLQGSAAGVAAAAASMSALSVSGGGAGGGGAAVAVATATAAVTAPAQGPVLTQVTAQGMVTSGPVGQPPQPQYPIQPTAAMAPPPAPSAPPHQQDFGLQNDIDQHQQHQQQRAVPPTSGAAPPTGTYPAMPPSFAPPSGQAQAPGAPSFSYGGAPPAYGNAGPAMPPPPPASGPGAQYQPPPAYPPQQPPPPWQLPPHLQQPLQQQQQQQQQEQQQQQPNYPPSTLPPPQQAPGGYAPYYPPQHAAAAPPPAAYPPAGAPYPPPHGHAPYPPPGGAPGPAYMPPQPANPYPGGPPPANPYPGGPPPANPYPGGPPPANPYPGGPPPANPYPGGPPPANPYPGGPPPANPYPGGPPPVNPYPGGPPPANPYPGGPPPPPPPYGNYPGY